jgi:hypothetical protein
MLLSSLLNVQLATLLGKLEEEELPLEEVLEVAELECFGLTFADPGIQFKNGYVAIDLPFGYLEPNPNSDVCKKVEEDLRNG